MTTISSIRRPARWRRLIARVLLVTLAWTQSVGAATVTLATSPLANSTSTAVRPNIMYVLDDSGSMAWDYTPDYVNDGSTGAMCWGTNSGAPNDSDNPAQCSSYADMPWATADINYQYYDPEVRYTPPVNANGTSYPASTPTAAKLDGYGIASTSTTNLTNSYTHTSWCNSSSRTPTAADPTNGGNCVENKDTTSSANLYPNYGKAYARTFSGAPYYYTMEPSEYCSDSNLTSCVRSTTATTIGGIAYTYPSLYRWCSSFSTSSHSFSGCQGRWSAGTPRPNYLGGYASSASSGSKASAAITISSVSSGQSITAVNVNGVNIMSAGTISSPANGTTVTQIAQALCSSIQARTATSGYGCPTTPTSGTLTIVANTAGTTPNGYPVVVVGPAAVAGANSVGSLAVTSAVAGSRISQISIHGNNLLTSAVTATGAIDTTAQAICNAIKVGPSSSIYQARTGSATWGTCSAGGTGIVEIMRTSADTVDNGYAVVVTGGSPAAGANATATLTVNATSGATQVSDITLGGVSILTGTLPLTFADGTAVNSVATAIAARINSNYTKSVSGGTITLTRATKDTTDNGKVLAATNTGAAATATITVGGAASGSNAGTLGTIAVSGTQIVRALTTTDLPTVLSTNSATNAQTITGLVTGGFTASRSSNVITVTAPVGNTVNGVGFTITAGTAGTQAGAATKPVWKFNITSGGGTDKEIKEIRCGTDWGTNVIQQNDATTGWGGSSTWVPSLATTISGDNGYTVSCTVATPSVCTITGPNTGPTPCSSKRLYIDSSDGITCGQATGGGTLSVSDCDGYINIATDGAAAGPSITYVDFKPYLSSTTFSGGRAAQSITGSTMNGGVVPTIGTTTSAMTAGAVGAGAFSTNATGTAPNTLAMSGGADGVAANSRAYAGIFKRTDIVPTANSHTAVRGASVTVGSAPTYPKTSGRTDCAGASNCTYTEELQNFANWYTYYRTRMQMMKTVSTHAFIGLNGNYRVGFDTISDCASGCNTTVRLPVAQFVDSGGETASQKTNWWAKLVATTTPSATPLRAETAKIGRYYAGKLTVSAAHKDPMQYSCQQNFALLVTDGYWNETDSSDIKKVDGTDIGNTDNNLATTGRPFYDGQMASTTCPSLGSTRGSASSCRTLADIAWYYANTDIRSSAFSNATNVASGQDVATNNVPVTTSDTNTGQHMVFYAMGLGIDGTLLYRPDYDTAGVGDYAEIVAGTRQWPAVANLDPTGIDDLWHATVNGRGRYFSARNPTEVALGLADALNDIQAKSGAAAAAATSTMKPVAGDNFAYVSSYKTVAWTGDLQARQIDQTTGAVSTDTVCGATGSGCLWSAQALLDAQGFANRTIYIAPTSNTSGATPRLFTYGNLVGATEQGYFNPNTLSQWGALSASDAASITATKLVDYLRGDRSLERNGVRGQPQIWRKRTHVLGDIVDSKPLYVKAPAFSYADAGYADFKAGSASTRAPMLYVGANDGMLHAFDAATGTERWAFIPDQAMAAMKQLADFSYTHRNYVNGPMTVGDVNFGGGDNDWHTILVAGMGGGGTQYFALDITDPANPEYLWQFTHSGLGYTYGNISINKLPDGSWAAFFSSGYNNADGIGRLYAVDVKTGALKTGYPLSTASGSAGSPSNLGQINVWVDRPRFDNTAKFIYAGDLNGDLWRFDPAPSTGGHSGASVFKLAHLQNASGQAQPITTKPEMTKVGDKTVIYVGTGQYLGIPDLTTTQVQSFYAIKDTLGAKNLAAAGQSTWNPRSDTATIGGVPNTSLFLPRKLIGTMDDGNPVTLAVDGVDQAARMVCAGTNSFVDHLGVTCGNGTHAAPAAAPPTMDWSAYGGWYVDFPDTGERMNVDMQLVAGTLIFATNVPESTVCTSGGHGYLNFLDYRTGLAVVSGNGKLASIKFDTTLLVGLAPVQLGTTVMVEASGADKTVTKTTPPVAASDFGGRRVLWREFEVY